MVFLYSNVTFTDTKLKRPAYLKFQKNKLFLNIIKEDKGFSKGVKGSMKCLQTFSSTFTMDSLLYYGTIWVKIEPLFIFK